MRVSREASASKSPANCSTVKRSNGLLRLNALNHVVAKQRDVAVVVAVIAVGVGKANHVEPIHRHPLAVVRRGQHPVHQVLVGLRRRIGQERRDLLGRGGQARQVERKSPHKRRAAGLGRRRHSQRSKFRAHEQVDRIDNVRCHASGWRVGASGLFIRPMLLPGSPFSHPAA